MNRSMFYLLNNALKKKEMLRFEKLKIQLICSNIHVSIKCVYNEV